MKTKLTSADKPGWWLCDHSGDTSCYWWNGEHFSHGPKQNYQFTPANATNFRRLVEAVDPEVIEGRGQPLEKGWYWRYDTTDGDLTVVSLNACNSTLDGCRYIRIPDPRFPPRPPAIPPKPELVLVQLSQGGNQEWAVDLGDKVCLLGGKVNKSACWKVEKQA